MLNTPRLVLRQSVIADAPLMLKWENNRSNWFVSGTYQSYTRFEIENFIEKQITNDDSAQYRFVIVSLDNGSTLGYIDLFDIDYFNNRAGISILIGEVENRGKGFASEALTAIIKHAKENLKLIQLFCNIHVTNIASMKLFIRHDFEQTGILKKWSFDGNDFVDVNVMQLFL
jgi:diamine N-acetyltransferase